MIEDLEPDDDDTDVFETSPSVAEVPGAGQRWVELPSASLLSVADADRLLRWRECSLIAVVGERNGGKTTLMTELYERFLRGPFEGKVFADSFSLHGFERKSFQSRAESGAELPDTPRTSKQDGLLFFHLAVSDEISLSRTDLLIAERAGEIYRDVRDRPSEAHQVVEVKKAATVAFIIDGERVADGRRRAEAFASVRSMARALSDSGVVSRSAELQTVVTKYDLLQSDSSEAALSALNDFEMSFSATYKDNFAKVSHFRTAARDPSGKIPVGTGLGPLLQSWLQPKDVLDIPSPTLPKLIDEFDRLLLRRPN